MIARFAVAAALAATSALAFAGAPSAAHAPDQPPPAFLTFESGVLVGVNWVEREGMRVHTRSILTRSRVIDATITLRVDETATRASTVLAEAGKEPQPPIERSLGEGAIYWSDMTPASIEQAVRRARVLGQPTARIAATSLFRETRDIVDVARVDSTSWTVRCHGKRYDVLTDSTGRMLSAALPEFGVTIERREGFSPGQYALWPPHGAPPDSAYRALDVAIKAPQGHVLAGTLTIPRGAGPFAAAVLITGLSPNNRNEGDPPWMPLRDVADALTRKGIAVLRVDDRGVGASTGDRGSSTTFDEVDDVKTEVAWLRKRPRIDGRRIALVGYSEGGLIAPMVAADDRTIAAIVTMAGPGVSGSEVAQYQIEAAVTRDSTVAPAEREAVIAKLLADSMTIREQSYLSIDPLAYARRTRCPALLLHGGNDLTVPPRSAERLAWAMRSAGNADVTVILFPGVSHSLLPDLVGLNSGWAYLPAFLTSPEILRATAEWLNERLVRKGPPGRRRQPGKA